MKGRFLAATLTVAFLAAGCAEQGQQQAAEDTAAAAEDTAAAATADTSPADAREVTLSAKNQSGVTGTAGWTVEGDSVTFDLSLEGLEPNQQYPAHVHQGSCEAGGGVAAGLNPVAADADGTGEGSATVARSGFSSGQTYFVQVHLPDGTPAACGDLPAEAGLAPGSGGQSQSDM